MKLVRIDPHDNTLATAYINMDYVTSIFTIDDTHYVNLVGEKQSNQVTKEAYENILKYGKAN